MDSYFQAMPYDVQREIYNKVYVDHVTELNNKIKELEAKIHKTENKNYELKARFYKLKYNKLKTNNNINDADSEISYESDSL